MIKQILLIAFILVGVISCDCDYDYKFNVQNDTSNDIFVVFHGGYQLKIVDSIRIESGNRELLFSDNDYWPGGCPGPDKDDFYFVFDSLEIRISDTITSNVDFMNVEKWEYKPFDKGADFLLTVKQDDF